MNEYRNIKTGAVIRTASVISAKDWELVEPPKKKRKKTKE